MQLRRYQQDAVSAARSSLAAGRNPVLQLATGTGKSLIIAALARPRTWVLTHIQQLVEQNAKTYERFTGSAPGIICAGLKRKDTRADVIFATIQSIKGVLAELPEPDLIIIDEAHRVPHRRGEHSMYDSILRRYPRAKRIAMTATPWRMDNGIIYGDGESFWFDHLAFNYPVKQAVADGWLTPLVGVETAIQLDVDEVDVDDDFNQEEVGELQTQEWLESVARSLPHLAGERKHIAVYCPTVAAANRALSAILEETGWRAELITGAMAPEARKAILRRFAERETRVLVSIDTLTTGFDLPSLDCIVCLRPTLSSSLWVQIQGRGTRLANNKKNCLVLDYVGNLIRLGGVDMYERYYREDSLEEVEAKPLRPHVKRERKYLPGVRKLTPIDPMTGLAAGNGTALTVDVHAVSAVAIKTKRDPNNYILMVQYACTTAENARIDATLFVNTVVPREQDYQFFKQRGLAVKIPAPAQSVAWAVRAARVPKQLQVRKAGKYWNVVAEHFTGVEGSAEQAA
jgi:superfamily II DNA or RNA helicase